MARGDTRQRIQDVALELFAEKGYESTSLREIAERLDVTKAALYYHFKTKEDILVSLAEDLGAPLDDLIEWGKGQPRTLATKKELLDRYSVALMGGVKLFRFMQENQAALRNLHLGETFKDRMFAVQGLLRDEDASLADQVRCTTAIFSLHAGFFALRDVDADPEVKRLAMLEVAQDLITASHHGA
ncbi:hypothetical protein SRB5_48240 [Streptomyces sp. RB5]|uniref:HTH tetR-type domain-containing protein n=1 Tax=Streptomyces smaragdinus TaxID=2585196 RepID=A0A7K0CME8_9ACTN|nr:TetR/AcrR family transcriptional regulator [Streptomyces smaragdinus]MQY14649.1 hypothetical protein [Streptomyces smaragdinus]